MINAIKRSDARYEEQTAPDTLPPEDFIATYGTREDLPPDTNHDEWDDVPSDYRTEVYGELPTGPGENLLGLDRIAAEKLLKRYHRLAAEEREAVLFVDDEIARAEETLEALRARRAELLKPIERKRAWLDQFKGLLESWARQALEGQKARSIKLTYGAVKFRKGPDRLEVIDEARAIEWARTSFPEAIKESINKTALKHAVKDWGEMPFGCELVPGEDTFTVEVAE